MSGELPWSDRRTLQKLTLAQRRNLMALPSDLAVWATVSEMRGNGATGSGMDLLHVHHSPKLSERRWVRWGSELGQKRGEGYEYSITAYGLHIRELIGLKPVPEKPLSPDTQEGRG